MLWHRQAIFESKGDKLSSSAESRIRTQGLRYLFTSRLNACWQTDWAIEDQAKNLNSTARPYDQQAFSPLDLTANWLSHLALAIYMFVVDHFDALAQASDLYSNLKETSCLPLLKAGFEPKVSDTYSPADWMPADKPTELSRIKLKTWTRQPVPMISKHSAHSIHFYSGICTGTGNIFIGDFRMSMLRWFWESTPKWLSFKMRLSFWLQLTYWYDQMRNKDWHFRVAWPGIELSTCRVTGRCLIHYTTSESITYDGFTRTLSSVNTKSTNFEEKVIPGITGTGTFTKSGPALSLKDRLWTSFSVRCLQYIPSKKKWSDVKIGIGIRFSMWWLQ